MVVHARGRCGRVSRSSSVYVCVRVCVCVGKRTEYTEDEAGCHMVFHGTWRGRGE